MLLYWSRVLITERVVSTLLQKRSIMALPRLNIGALQWWCSTVDSLTVAKRVKNLTIELLISVSLRKPKPPPHVPIPLL